LGSERGQLLPSFENAVEDYMKMQTVAKRKVA
jgi:hypothetical protein